MVHCPNADANVPIVTQAGRLLGCISSLGTGAGVIVIRELTGMGVGGPHGKQFLFGEFSSNMMGNGLRWVLP